MRSLGWAVVSKADASEMLGPVTDQRRIGAGMLALAAVLLAALQSCSAGVGGQAAEREPGDRGEVNTSATELSSASGWPPPRPSRRRP